MSLFISLLSSLSTITNTCVLYCLEPGVTSSELNSRKTSVNHAIWRLFQKARWKVRWKGDTLHFLYNYKLVNHQIMLSRSLVPGCCLLCLQAWQSPGCFVYKLNNHQFALFTSLVIPWLLCLQAQQSLGRIVHKLSKPLAALFTSSTITSSHCLQAWQSPGCFVYKLSTITRSHCLQAWQSPGCFICKLKNQ